MKYTTINPNAEQKFMHFIPQISDSAKIGLIVHLLDIVIKTGKYFPVISICLIGLNLLLAVNDFLANNIGFALLNSMFVISGLIFFVQTRLIDKTSFSKVTPSKKFT